MGVLTSPQSKAARHRSLLYLLIAVPPLISDFILQLTDWRVTLSAVVVALSAAGVRYLGEGSYDTANDKAVGATPSSVIGK